MIGARVHIHLKRSVLDVEGEAVRRALGGLGHVGVGAVRVGRVVELVLETDDEAEARERIDRMCRELLVSDIIEEHRVELVDAAEIADPADVAALAGGGA